MTATTKLNGKYFKPDGKTFMNSSPKSNDETLAKKLWAVSAQLAKIN